MEATRETAAEYPAAAEVRVRSCSRVAPPDREAFHGGTHGRLYQTFGAHLTHQDGTAGTAFAVWAPNAELVSVIGDFNHWQPQRHRLQATGEDGIWEGFIPGLGPGELYKYHVASRYEHYRADRSDPFGFRHEAEPETASVIWDLGYTWNDAAWMTHRGRRGSTGSPVSIYEVHLGSWMRVPEEGNRWLTYLEAAPRLAEYAERMGFTHIEFLPLMRHPFYGSWGYLTTGYFAPSGRFGSPQQLMYMIDVLHQRGLGVILDWVPSHFPTDEHGLAYFDGTHLFEPADPRRQLQPVWNSYAFDYARPEVRSFLLSSALFWLTVYHADGLRVDGVAPMLYLDHGRSPGTWVPNARGGRENLEAIAFLRQLNESVQREAPDTVTIAEESDAWPMVSRPTHLGGLGFGYKWDLGFSHDTLGYFCQEPDRRKFHHRELTFRGLYAFTEQFILPASHDEVAPGHASLLARMPGDDWRKRANLRLFFAHLFLQPGKKLVFMGGEFGQWNAWNPETSLDWHLLATPEHAGIQQWVRDLNRLYRDQPALHVFDADAAGFQWVDCHDADQSTLSWLRWGPPPEPPLLAVLNFTPTARFNFRVGVPRGGFWRELVNSDAREYGGSGHGNFGGLEAAPLSWHGQPHALNLCLPPLAAVVFKPHPA